MKKNNLEKKFCYIIGDPVSHSLSPAMHNAGYLALGLENKFEYLAKKVEAKNLKKEINALREKNILGASITIPYKEKVIKYLDKMNEVAEKIKAINTVINKNNKLIGYNTDWLGIINPLKKIIKLKNKQAAILGAGGAARAAVYGLTQAEAKVKIFNRDFTKAQRLAKEFNCEAYPLEEIEKIQSCDIIFNSTNVGMGELKNQSLVPKKYLNKNMIVFDAVYSPLKTKLLHDAEEKGAKIIYGLEMLLYQAIEQFELFTNKKASPKLFKAMREALRIN